MTRVGARTDLPLSVSGQSQAETLAVHFLAVLPEGFAKVLCSPLTRTRQTAATILALRPDAPNIEPVEFLREIDYGPDENQPETEVIARIGQHALDEWEESAVPPPGWDVDPTHLKQSWVKLLNDQTDGPVLIVTSNGIARFVLDAVTDFLTEPRSIKLKTGAYGALSVADDKVSLVEWNIRP